MSQMDSYKGRRLSLEHQELRECFEKAGGYFCVTGKEHKTIRLIKGRRNYGYINNTVLVQKGIMGYRSPDGEEPGFKDACPSKYYNRAEALFSKSYGAHDGWDRNPQDAPRLLKGRELYYLIITDLKLAKKVCDCFGWSHRSVYAALVKDPRFSNTSQEYVNSYVCITSDQQAGKGHSMILYSPSCKDSGAKNRPYQYDNNRISFTPSLQKKLGPVIGSKRHETNQGKNWFMFEVLDWDQFAHLLGLDGK